jgi:hypothetical protein
VISEVDRYTNMVGVTKVAFCEDKGVEHELLIGFQRLARYPGVDVNDLKTLSGPENELSSVIEIPDDWSFNEAGGGGNDGFASASTSSVFAGSRGFSPSLRTRLSI